MIYKVKALQVIIANDILILTLPFQFFKEKNIGQYRIITI